jgi:hypothetical protein
VEKVREYSFISNIVVDGFRHQMQAVRLFSKSAKGNFQNFLSKSDIPLPYSLPDVAHILQLCLTHAKKNNDVSLGEDITKIDKLAMEIRKHFAVFSIGSRYPIYSPTRFFHIVLTMQFMVEIEQQILEFAKKFQIFFNCFYFFKVI